MQNCLDIFSDTLSIEIDTSVEAADIPESSVTTQFNKYFQESENILSLISFLGDNIYHTNDSLTAYSDKEIAAIDKKLNICIKLITMLINDNGTIESQTVKLSAKGLAWQSEKAFTIGQNLLVKFYPSREFPRPVILPVTIISQALEQQNYQTCAKFIDLTQSLTDALEKFIFQQHRRYISQHKNK